MNPTVAEALRELLEATDRHEAIARPPSSIEDFMASRARVIAAWTAARAALAAYEQDDEELQRLRRLDVCNNAGYEALDRTAQAVFAHAFRKEYEQLYIPRAAQSTAPEQPQAGTPHADAHE